MNMEWLYCYKFRLVKLKNGEYEIQSKNGGLLGYLINPIWRTWNYITYKDFSRANEEYLSLKKHYNNSIEEIIS